jgi:uncharacterized protein (DUF433 family)
VSPKEEWGRYSGFSKKSPQGPLVLPVVTESDPLLNILKPNGETMDYRSIITIEPGKRSGKPCIRGLRITVYDVLGMLAAGMSHSEILADFPYLTEEDIKACLAYAADSDRRLLIVGS